MITFASLIFALGEFAQRGPLSIVFAAAAVALTFGWLLIRRQAGHPAPMLPVDLFRRPVFTLSALTAVCAFAAHRVRVAAVLFRNRPASQCGRDGLPDDAVVGHRRARRAHRGRLSDRYPPGLLGAIGLALLSAGMVSLAALPAAPGVVDIGWRMMLCGAGFGFFQSPNLKALMSSAPPERSGGASGSSRPRG